MNGLLVSAEFVVVEVPALVVAPAVVAFARPGVLRPAGLARVFDEFDELLRLDDPTVLVGDDGEVFGFTVAVVLEGLDDVPGLVDFAAPIGEVFDAQLGMAPETELPAGGTLADVQGFDAAVLAGRGAVSV